MSTPTARWSRRTTRLSTIRDFAVNVLVPFICVTVAAIAGVVASVCDWRALRALQAEVTRRVTDPTRAGGAA